jgi:hypothetical protein
MLWGMKVNDFQMDDFKTIAVVSVAKMECARPGRPDAPRVKLQKLGLHHPGKTTLAK